MKPRYVLKLLRDVGGMARERKALWIVPLMVILLVAGLMVVASQAATPFIYTIF